jgi:hypothetical protein
VSGLTIRNGYIGGFDGEGIYGENFSPTIESNIIEDCSGSNGGGIFALKIDVERGKHLLVLKPKKSI